MSVANTSPDKHVTCIYYAIRHYHENPTYYTSVIADLSKNMIYDKTDMHMIMVILDKDILMRRNVSLECIPQLIDLIVSIFHLTIKDNVCALCVHVINNIYWNYDRDRITEYIDIIIKLLSYNKDECYNVLYESYKIQKIIQDNHNDDWDHWDDESYDAQCDTIQQAIRDFNKKTDDEEFDLEKWMNE